MTTRRKHDELDAASLATARVGYAHLPAKVQADLTETFRRRGERGPQKAPTKQAVSIRLDRDIIAGLKRGGKGWQGRANLILRRGLKLKAKSA